MMDLENRLRTTFTEMADEQPPSADPRGDLERRLATRGKGGWRTPALVAAAAAVVAAVAVPAVMVGGEGRDPSVSVGSNAQDTPARSAGNPFLGSFTEDGVTREVYVSLRGEEVCLEVRTGDGGSVTTTDGEPVCAIPGDVVLEDPLVKSMGVLSEGAQGTGPLPNLVLFLAPRLGHQFGVTDQAGEQMGFRVVAMNDQSVLWLSDFGNPAVGYTVHRSEAVTLEDAIRDAEGN
jgi:hypothetical protein